MTTPAHKWREAPEEIRAKCRSICGENDINNENEDVFMYLRKEIDTATDMAYQAGLDTHSAHLVERIERKNEVYTQHFESFGLTDIIKAVNGLNK